MADTRKTALAQDLVEALPHFPPDGNSLLMVDGVPSPQNRGYAEAVAYTRVIAGLLAAGVVRRTTPVHVGDETMPLGIALCLGPNQYAARWALDTAGPGEWSWRDAQGHALLARMAADSFVAMDHWLLCPALRTAPEATLGNDMPELVRCASRRADRSGVFMETLATRGYDARQPALREVLRDHPGRDGLRQLIATSTLDEPLEEWVHVDSYRVSRQGPGILPAWWVGLSTEVDYGRKNVFCALGEDDLRAAAGKGGLAGLAVAWLRLCHASSQNDILAAWRGLPEGPATRDPEGRPALWHGLSRSGGLVRRSLRAAAEGGLLATRGLDGCGFWTFAMAVSGTRTLAAMTSALPGAAGILPHPGDEVCADGQGVIARLLSEGRLGEFPLHAESPNGPQLLRQAGWRMDGLWAAPPAALATLRTRFLAAAEAMLEDVPPSTQVFGDIRAVDIRGIARATALCRACTGDDFAQGQAIAALAGPLALLLLARLAAPAASPVHIGDSPGSWSLDGPFDIGETTHALLRAAAVQDDMLFDQHFPTFTDRINTLFAEHEARHDVRPHIGEAKALVDKMQPLVAAARQNRALAQPAPARQRHARA